MFGIFFCAKSGKVHASMALHGLTNSFATTSNFLTAFFVCVFFLGILGFKFSFLTYNALSNSYECTYRKSNIIEFETT